MVVRDAWGLSGGSGSCSGSIEKTSISPFCSFSRVFDFAHFDIPLFDDEDELFGAFIEESAWRDEHLV